VFPLDNSILERLDTPRPSATAGRTLFTYSGALSGLDPSNAANILGKSFTITAEVELPKGGGDGMIVTEGGGFGGFGSLPAEGQTRVSIQPARSGAVPMGRP
jgi:hypothetical protein